ncbi:MAG TPA: hypothetical protein VGD08_02485, partial [Stellaceae bacterium]
QCPHRHRRLRIPYPTSNPTMSNSRDPGGSIPAGASRRRGGAGFYTRLTSLSTGLADQPTDRPTQPLYPAPETGKHPTIAATRGADHVLSM